MCSTKLFVVVVCGVLQQAWSRSISLSLNMSLALSEDHNGITADVLHYCMKETDMTVEDLNHFRDNILAHDPGTINSLEDIEDDGTNNRNFELEKDMSSIIDYDNMFSEKKQEALQCFAYCLYEQMGLIKNGVFTEHELFRKLFTLFMEHEKTPITECMNLSSNKTCEAFYMMHICYNKLKSMEAERKIQEILENEAREANFDDMDNDETGTEIGEIGEVGGNETGVITDEDNEIDNS